MADKDLAAMFAKLAPLVDHWYFCDLPTPRAESAAGLAARWQAQAPARKVPFSTHASPEEALRAATAAADPTDRILVFGSFYTVGGVLADGVPRLHARHLG
jgi:dihydrofolate synthase/folylpolyglutamate synthase